MKKLFIEVCANSALSCVEAEKGGAGRVELCAGIPEGGTTPSYGEIYQARKRISIELNVIIRPRGGDFLYSRDEIEIMKTDIMVAKQLGADGVVFGCLTPNGDVDMTLCKELIDVSAGMSITFHRAFDVCRNPKQALEDIISLGFNRILTSGCMPTAYEGRELIRELIIQSDKRIIIMAGCGVNESNIKELREYTGGHEFHTSARETIDSLMLYRNDKVSMGGVVKIDEFTKDTTSSKRVEDIIRLSR